ncbi:NAD(P)-dependent oxidoreductase [Candidatus Methylospira mobilis]|uniref:NAD(P)-dependent oxidoreductase n=1 Tax=Candidatus Methylospira mobilis TaxID=1808979 RepID=A0A5Q0BSY3_9GAMM|nr:NAD(P)-dependent oxidoreductase [Candidatus Methylospira mobilis]
MQAGFIGLGAMGRHMARNLATQGLLKTLWNRTTATAEALAQELGVAAAPNPSSLAASVDAVMICVSADDDVRSVIEQLLPGLKPGTLVIDHSTVSRETELEMTAKVAAAGGSYLDAPVSGGMEGARHRTLSIMAGGRAEDLQRARPLLQAMAARIVHMGGIGSGQAAKAVNQIMCAGINQAVTEALSFAQAQGLAMDKVIEAVAGGAAGNWFLDKRGLTMTQGSYEPGFKLALHHKDLAICLAMAERAGMKLPVAETTLHHYKQLMQQGHGEEDISALYRLKNRQRQP